MKLILLADVKKVGQRGTLVTVADGYGNNVLIPKKLAVPATSENIKRYERVQEGIKQKGAMEALLAKKTLELIRGHIVTILARANEKGTLFQSVHAGQIVEALQKQLKVSIPEEAVALPDGAIKKLGEHKVSVTLLGTSVDTTVSVVAI